MNNKGTLHLLSYSTTFTTGKLSALTVFSITEGMSPDFGTRAPGYCKYLAAMCWGMYSLRPPAVKGSFQGEPWNPLKPNTGQNCSMYVAHVDKSGQDLWRKSENSEMKKVFLFS